MMPNMSPEKQMLLTLRGHIYGLPPEERAKIEANVAEFKAILKRQEEESVTSGVLAFSLVGAELAAEEL